MEWINADCNSKLQVVQFSERKKKIQAQNIIPQRHLATKSEAIPKKKKRKRKPYLISFAFRLQAHTSACKYEITIGLVMAAISNRTCSLFLASRRKKKCLAFESQYLYCSLACSQLMKLQSVLKKSVWTFYQPRTGVALKVGLQVKLRPRFSGCLLLHLQEISGALSDLNMLCIC